MAPFTVPVDASPQLGQNPAMDSQAVIDRLSQSSADLKAMGLQHLSVFGSTARGEALPGSDVDLAVTLDKRARIDLFRFAAINERIARLLGVDVDIVVEPARNQRVQAEIDRDRLRVY